MPGAGDRDGPTLLMVGGGEPMDQALHGALERHGVFVEIGDATAITEAALAAAPDLVLLVGDAARDGGADIMRQLVASPATSLVPVAVVAGEWPLPKRVEAFRQGAVAVLPRGASVDDLARRIETLAKGLVERPGAAVGELGEATLEALVDVFTRALRAAIAPSGDPASTRIVLGPGRPLVHALDGFIVRMQGFVGGVEPVHFELGGAPKPRPALSDVDPGDPSTLEVLRGLRVLLVVYDPARGDALARELRAREAVVALTDGSGRGLEGARTLVPEVAIVDAARIREPSFEILRALRRDPRLRWTSILVSLKDEIWSEGALDPDVGRLCTRLSALLDADRTLRARAAGDADFETRLEVTGPWRLLRALGAAEGTLHVVVETSQGVVELDVGGGLVVGARAKRGEAKLEGSAALAILLAAVAGRVRVARRVHPEIANLVTPIEIALEGAASDLPSQPPAVASEPPVAAPARPARMDETPPPRAAPLVFRPPPPVDSPPAPVQAAAVPAVDDVVPAPAPPARRWRLVAALGAAGIVGVVVLVVALSSGGSEANVPTARPAATSASPAASAPVAAEAPVPATVAAGRDAGAQPDEDTAASQAEKRARAAALILRASRLRKSGQIPQAEELFRQALRLHPRNFRAAEGLARIYLQRRRGQGAVEFAERAVRGRPGSPGLRVLLGDAYALAGDRGRAERQWKAALKLRPRFPEARSRLGM